MAVRRRAIDMQRIRNGIGSWVLDTLGPEIPHLRSLWADQGGARERRPFVSMDLDEGLGMEWIDVSSDFRCAPTSTLVSVAGPLAMTGHQYGYLLNGPSVSYIAQLGDTSTDVRDALVAAMLSLDDVTGTGADDDGVSEITVTPVGVDSLRIIPRHENGVLIARPWASSSGLTQIVEATADITETWGSRTSALSINCFSEHATGPDTADEIAATLVGSIAEPETRLALRSHGITVWGVPSRPRNLSGLVGGRRERRFQFDMKIAMISRMARQAATLTRVTVSGAVAGNSFVTTPGA